VAPRDELRFLLLPTAGLKTGDSAPTVTRVSLRRATWPLNPHAPTVALAIAVERRRNLGPAVPRSASWRARVRVKFRKRAHRVTLRPAPAFCTSRTDDVGERELLKDGRAHAVQGRDSAGERPARTWVAASPTCGLLRMAFSQQVLGGVLL